jgi:hypothetical protein
MMSLVDMEGVDAVEIVVTSFSQYRTKHALLTRQALLSDPQTLFTSFLFLPRSF